MHRKPRYILKYNGITFSQKCLNRCDLCGAEHKSHKLLVKHKAEVHSY